PKDAPAGNAPPIDIWDLPARRRVTTLKNRHIGVASHRFSDDSRLLFAAEDDDLVVHEVPSGFELWRWPGSRRHWHFRYNHPSQTLLAYPLHNAFRNFGTLTSDRLEFRDALRGTVRLSYQPITDPSTAALSADGPYAAVINPATKERLLNR